MIRPGDEWGGVGIVPVDTPVVESDAQLAAVVRRHLDRGDPVPLVGLAGGDLCRTLGGRGDIAGRRGGEATIVDVDLGVVRVGEMTDVFVAHLVARRRGWRGPFAVVMNAEYLGALRLAPRGHPGDSRFDLTEGSLPWRDRLMARQRARTGDHLPHPALRTRRVEAVTLSFARPVCIRLDGRRWTTGRTVEITRHDRTVRIAV